MKDTDVVVAAHSSPSNTERAPGPRTKRGFATMTHEQVRELARRGGVASHRAGTAHKFNSEEARAAGRKGGLAAHASPKPSPTESHS
jgi:uncharacterized protein